MPAIACNPLVTVSVLLRQLCTELVVNQLIDSAQDSRPLDRDVYELGAMKVAVKDQGTMHVAALRYLLAPDGSAARRVRRLLAEQGACSGVIVGTWLELLEWAYRAYLMPYPNDDWEAVFYRTLAELDDAFGPEVCPSRPSRRARLWLLRYFRSFPLPIPPAMLTTIAWVICQNDLAVTSPICFA